MSIFVQGEQGVSGNFTGFLSIRTAFEGSKSERPQPFLEITEGLVPVFLKGDNPFSNAGLQPFLNKQVTCSGTWHRQTFVVSEIVEAVEEVVTSEVDSTVEAQSIPNANETMEPLEKPVEEIVDEDSSSEE